MEIPTETTDKINSDAFEWATDYKPFVEDLDYRQYAIHGFIEGQKSLLKKLIKKGILTEEQIKEYGTPN